MPEIKEQITPLGKLSALLTKQYLSVLGAKLSDLPIDRYFYAFWVISNNDGKITSKRLAEITQTDKVFIVRIIKYLTEKDRKSTRLNSSHVRISYAVFCLKKK